MITVKMKVPPPHIPTTITATTTTNNNNNNITTTTTTVTTNTRSTWTPLGELSSILVRWALGQDRKATGSLVTIQTSEGGDSPTVVE